jgi:hypothetical protein
VAAPIVKLLALATAVVSLTVVPLGLFWIVRAPAEIAPVGFRTADMAPFVIFQLAYAGVGCMLAWRRPENRIGWMLCATAIVSSALFVTAGLTVNAISAGDARAVGTAAWLYGWLTLLIGATQGPLMATFPDGRVTSRATFAALVLLAVAVVLSLAAIALRPGPLVFLPIAENQYAWREHGGVLDMLFALGLISGLGAAVLGISSQIARFRRSSGVERQQLKWFLASVVVVSVLLVPSVAWSYTTDGTPDSTRAYLGRVIGALASALVPIAIGIAILRYRLYDIDVLIRRTLVYASVSAILVATYVAAVVLAGAILRPFTAGSDLAVAVSTLIVVGLFQPIRVRIHQLVDRHFYRSRYDASRTVDAFGARLREEVELDAVRADLLGVVVETVRPAHASVWLRER